MKLRFVTWSSLSFAGFVLAPLWACVGDSGGEQDGGADAAQDVTTTDAAPDAADAGAADVDAGPKACDVTAAFTSFAVLKNVNSPTNEYSATLMPDEKTIFLSSSQNPYDGGATPEMILTATRATVAVDFSTPTIAAGVNINGQQVGDPSLSADGDTMFMTSFTTSWDIYVATRSTPQAVFSTPQLAANVNSNNTDIRPALRADGKELFFSSDRLNPSTRYLLFHALVSGSSFGSATEVTELENVAGGGKSLNAPTLSADGLTLYFPVSAGNSGDVWIARRATVNDPFGNAGAVAEVNVNAAISSPAWLSPDNCRLYVAQSGGDAGASFDLYVYSRAP